MTEDPQDNQDKQDQPGKPDPQDGQAAPQGPDDPRPEDEPPAEGAPVPEGAAEAGGEADDRPGASEGMDLGEAGAAAGGAADGTEGAPEHDPYRDEQEAGGEGDHGEYDYGEYDEYGESAYADEYSEEHDDDYEHEDEWEDEEEEEEEEEEVDELGQKKMTLVEHLDELRTRLIRALIALVVGMAAALALSPYAILHLSRPLLSVMKGQDGLITTSTTAPFMMYLKMSLYLGLIISSPVVFYQIWMFIAAGLYPHEKKYVRYAVPFSAGLFITGTLFFLLFISQYLLGFFYGFAKWLPGIDLKVQITLDNHLTFMTNMMLVFGLCFQTPIAVLILAKMGLVTTKTLSRFRKHVIVVILIIAAFSTSPSPVDQVALAIPMWMLYELGIVLAYFFVERKRRKEEREFWADDETHHEADDEEEDEDEEEVEDEVPED